MNFSFRQIISSHRKLIVFTVCLVLAGITTTLGLTQEKDGEQPFTELIATTSDSHLILFGTVKNTFTEEMLSGLKSGLPIRFHYFVELSLKDGDSPISTREFNHTLSYDTLKDSYSVLITEANAKVLQTGSLDEAHRLMSEVNGLEVVELDKLVENNTYTLRIRAELFEKTMPFGFEKLLPFLSRWGVETDWQILEFNY